MYGDSVMLDWKLIRKTRKETIDVLYHKWGVELFKDPGYKISSDDIKTMEWAKKGFAEALKNIQLEETAK